MANKETDVKNKVNSDNPEDMTGYGEIFCLKCKKPQPVLNPQKQKTAFESRKTHTPMFRLTIVGECSVCHRRVSRFAKQ